VPGIGVISNPRSRQNQRNPARMERLAYILGQEGAAQATESLESLERAAEYFKKSAIDVLAINGGDGTNHVTLTTFIKAYGAQPLPLVAMLRGGTMNTTANGLGVMRAAPSRILTNLVERYAAGEGFQTIKSHVLKVGDQYGFIFGNGVVQNFLEMYYGSGDPPTPATAAKVMARGIGSALINGQTIRRLFKRFEARIVADGEEWAQRDFITLAASTQPEIGLGFRPFVRARETAGRFHVLGIFTTPFGMIAELPRVFVGRPIQRNKVIDQVVQRLEIFSEGPILYTIDGDTYTAGAELVVECGPELSLIQR
jgi:diacylglycerol kinase family enzyme